MLRQMSSLRKAGIGLSNLLHVTGTSCTLIPRTRKPSTFLQFGRIQRYRSTILQIRRNLAGDSTKITLDETPSNIVNKDRLILVGLGKCTM